MDNHVASANSMRCRRDLINQILTLKVEYINVNDRITGAIIRNPTTIKVLNREAVRRQPHGIILHGAKLKILKEIHILFLLFIFTFVVNNLIKLRFNFIYFRLNCVIDITCPLNNIACNITLVGISPICGSGIVSI